MSLNLNEQLVGIYSLEMLNDNISKVSDDELFWQWVIISLHNALQSFMVCSLRGTNNLLVLEKKSAFKWFAEFARRTKNNVDDWESPKEVLDRFPSLFKKVQSNAILMYVHSEKLTVTESQIKSVKKLNYLRNEFVHFVPRFWGLGIDDFPTIVKDSLEIIKFLVTDSGNIVWIQDDYEQRTLDLLELINAKLNHFLESNMNSSKN